MNIEKLDTETVVLCIVKNGISPEMVELKCDNLTEAFERVCNEYPEEVREITKDVDRTNPYGVVLSAIIGVDDILAKRYLNDEITDSEFDHYRVWISMEAYLWFKSLIGEIDKDDFFTEASMSASQKFLKSQGDL